jgi:hypothetical protein
MFKRTAIFALAAAVLGLAVVSSSDASARPGHGGGGSFTRHVGGGMSGHHPRHIGSLIRHRHAHIHIRHVHRHGCFWRHTHIGHRHCHWHPRRLILVSSVATLPSVRSTTPGPCTCLTKTYLPNGAVLFRDVCTNESAVNPPQQAAEAPQQ